MLPSLRRTFVASACIPILFLASCSRSGLPAADSKEYAALVSAFYVGLAGLQTGEDTRAKEKLTLATQLAPGEPAAWADLALFTARQQDFEKAAQFAETARSLAPDNSAIEALLGAISGKRGNLSEAIAHFRKAVALDGGNMKARQSLASEIERQSTAGSDSEAQAELEKVLAGLPGNVSVQLDIARLAAKRGDAATLRRMAAELGAESKDWPDAARERLALFTQAADGPNPASAAVQAVFLRNVLVRVPEYRQSIDAVRTPAVFIADPFVRFIKLPVPDSKPAPPDAALAFTPADAGAGAPDHPALWAGAFPLDDSGRIRLVEADAAAITIREGARLPFAAPGTTGRNGVLAADLNYDFKQDIVLANSAGIRIYLQQTPERFDDITPRTKIPPNILKGNYAGVWAFDIDLDGDLDIVAGAAQGEPVVLRNNGDNTFAVLRPFPRIDGMIALASADLDGDGTPDIAMLDAAGALHVLMNQRFGVYREQPLPDSMKGRNAALAAADVNGDGTPDLVVLGEDGAVTRLSLTEGKQNWSIEQIVKAATAPISPATANLLLADFDNNGSTDILSGDGRLSLGSGVEIKIPAGLRIDAAADLNDDGRLDLIGIGAAGKPLQLLNRGSKRYNWQTLRVRAAKGTGDQRINSFGIGGEIEIRSGLLTQKQIISSPVLHFGLGERTQTEVARIVWPNGSVQAEFELKPNLSILAEQRLKGSCPMLFAWDGRRMSFVKDGAPWSPALGLHINAQAVAGIHQTEEWFKVPGDRLVERNGVYDLRVTAELWETFYIDHYSLKVVDHPEGTEIFTDERFAVEAPPLKIFTVAKPQPFARAADDLGNDVRETVRDADATYLDTFGRGRYQGVTRDHWVEMELPAGAPAAGSLYLVASGWMHPTDATVNIALGQNSDLPPQGLSIEAPDAAGRWTARKSGLGFLAGKGKTMVIDISRVFLPGAPRKLRLRTNLEIYWDQLAWAAGADSATTVVANAPLKTAELRYRGFSSMKAANASSPETPDYNRIAGTSQRWRDLEGYYTRPGDVRELIQKVDDRITIMNAGDELRLEFTALPAPPPGWKRDYVMVGDGWIKDGDYNCVFSNTVLPLPYHAMKNYDKAATTLEQDPAYRLHPSDWQTFHTRYVTPEWFKRALWN
ncbi:MAG: FG-GAP-like repeat-containing protein [Acidobacteriota bacterium]